MGWAVGFDSRWQRDIGYGVPSVCDHPKCSEQIDRGLSYVCGGIAYGGERGCGLFFCDKHLSTNGVTPNQCSRCRYRKRPFTPKPDTAKWKNHKLTDPSWAEWRDENPGVVAMLEATD
jgi:hypothetical protein